METPGKNKEAKPPQPTKEVQVQVVCVGGKVGYKTWKEVRSSPGGGRRGGHGGRTSP